MDNPEDDFLGGYQPPPEGALKELGIGTFQGASLDIPGGLTDIAPFASYLLNRNPAMVEVMAPHYQAIVEEYGSDALAETFLPPVEEGLESYREAGRLAGGVAGLGEMLTAKVSKILGRQISKILKNRDGVLVAVTPEGDQIPVPNEALDAPDTSVMQMADEGGEPPAQGDLFDQSRLDPDDPRVLPTDLDAYLAASAQRRDAELADLQKATREGYRPGPRRTNTPLTVSELNMLRAMRAGKGGARGLLHGIRGAKSKVDIDQDKVENLLDPAYRGTFGNMPAIFPEELNLYGGPFDVHGFQPVGSMDVTIKDLILSGGMSQRSKQILAETDAAKSAEGGRPGFSVSRDPLISVKGFTDQGDATDTFNVSSLEDTVIVIPSVQLRREDYFGNRLDRDDVESFSAGDILESDLEALSPSQYMLKAYDPDKSIQLKPNTEFNEDELHLGSGQGFGTPAGAIVRNLTDREKEDLVRYSNRIAIQRNNLKKIKSLNYEDSAFTNITSPDRMNYNTLGFGNPDLVTKGVKELEEELVILGTMEAESPLMLNLTRDRFITALGPKIKIGLQSPEFRAAWAAKHGNEGLAALEELGRKAGVLDPRNRESRPSISNRKQALEDAAQNFHDDLIQEEITDKLNLLNRGFTIDFEHGGEGAYENTLKLMPPRNDLQEALIEALRTNSEGLYGEAARRLLPEDRDLGVMILDGIRRVEKRYVTEVDKLPEAQSFNAIYRNNKYLLQSAIETAGNAFPATGTDRINLDPELKEALAALKRSRRGDPEGPKSYARDIVAKREARMRPAGAQLYAEGGIVSMIPKVVNNYHAGGYVHSHSTGFYDPTRESVQYFYNEAGDLDSALRRTPSPIEAQTGVYVGDFTPAPPTSYRPSKEGPPTTDLVFDEATNTYPLTADQQKLLDAARQLIMGNTEYEIDMLALEGPETYGLMGSAFDMDPVRQRQALNALGITSLIPQLTAQERNIFTSMPAVMSPESAQIFNNNYGSYFPYYDQITINREAINESIAEGTNFQDKLTNMHELLHAGINKRMADMVKRRPTYFQSLGKSIFGPVSPALPRPGSVEDFRSEDAIILENQPSGEGPFQEYLFDIRRFYAYNNVPEQNRLRFEDINQYAIDLEQRAGALRNDFEVAKMTGFGGPTEDLVLKIEAAADEAKFRAEVGFQGLIKPYLTSLGGPLGKTEFDLEHSLVAVPTTLQFLPQAAESGPLFQQVQNVSGLANYAGRYLPEESKYKVEDQIEKAGLFQKYPLMEHYFYYGTLGPHFKDGQIIDPPGFEVFDKDNRRFYGDLLDGLLSGKFPSKTTANVQNPDLQPLLKQIKGYQMEVIPLILNEHRSLTSRFRRDIIEPGMSGAEVTGEDIALEDTFIDVNEGR
tara:strand:- start:12926 stop:17056 length:4131 start_codon:yes stop_codon:yes gene_type:complete